jgi:hypothetical protein
MIKKKNKKSVNNKLATIVSEWLPNFKENKYEKNSLTWA